MVGGGSAGYIAQHARPRESPSHALVCRITDCAGGKWRSSSRQNEVARCGDGNNDDRRRRPVATITTCKGRRQEHAREPKGKRSFAFHGASSPLRRLISCHDLRFHRAQGSRRGATDVTPLSGQGRKTCMRRRWNGVRPFLYARSFGPARHHRLFLEP